MRLQFQLGQTNILTHRDFISYSWNSNNLHLNSKTLEARIFIPKANIKLK
jgi:hypothetical protein